MIDYIHAHQPGFWIALGFLMLAAEVLLFGFSTIIFLFAGIGAVITGLMMMTGVLTASWIAGMASFGISTGIVSLLLWKPMKKLQDRPVKAQAQSSDLVGYEFVLQQDVSMAQPGMHRYSGVTWRIEPDASETATLLHAGQRVSVTSLDAGVFRVKAV
jgi:hypothetical protein